MADARTSLTENPLSPDARKNEKDFGLKVLRQCYNRWKNGYGGETYSERMLRYEKNRLYAMGKQPQEQYVDIVKVEGRIPILNIDYSALAIAPPLLNAKQDRYMGRNEEIRCKASGPLIQSKKKKDKDEAKYKLNYAEAIQGLMKQSGLHLEDFSDDDPKSARELEIQFKTTRKQKVEIIMQMAINIVFKLNNWDTAIKQRLIWDVFNAGFCVALTELDGNGWIKTPFVKPESFITSYSEFDNFYDWQWQGQRRSIAISEIRLRYDIDEQQLWELAIKFTGSYGNPVDWYAEWSDEYITALARPYDAFNVEIVDLYYKTLYNLKYSKVTNKFGRESLVDPQDIKKSSGQVTGEERSKPYYVAYHGVWIIDTDFVLEWGLAKNMLKPNNNLVEIRSPYTIHMHNNNKCRNTPLVETMIPLIDLIQNIHMQTLKLIAMVAPDGFNVDVLGLANMDLGQGVGVVSPMQAFDIYLQTGTQYFMGKDLDAEGREQKPPITPNNHPYGTKLAQLDEHFWSAYKKLQIITGDNALASGQITNQAVANSTLSDAVELAAEPSNYVHKTVINCMAGVAKNIELLLLDKFFLKDDSFDGYNQVLGEDDIEYMRSMGEDLAEIVFETEITVANDDADKARWDRFIEIALEQGQITPADVAKLDMITDQTYRSFLFAQAVEDKKANDAQIATMNTKNNLEQAKAAADTKGQHDMALEQQAHINKIAQMQKQQEGESLKQTFTWAGVLKEKVADAILSKPDAKLGDIPPFIWEGLGIIDEAQKQIVLDSLQRMGEEKQKKAMEQMVAQQQAAQAQQQQELQNPNPQQGQAA